MIQAKFMCLREIYAADDFRVISCISMRKKDKIKSDKKYGTFTISGSNIDFIKINKEYECTLVEVKDGKYSNSYKLVSRDVNAEIKQAQIDLIESAAEYGYKEDEADKLILWYDSIKSLQEAIAENPYMVYMDKLGWGFVKADNLIIKKWSKWLTSKERCERLVVYTLMRDAEINGNTRMYGSELFRQCAVGYSSCVQHILVVCQESPWLCYDAANKIVSLKRLYEAEKAIADAIKARLYRTGKEWDIEQYRTVSGFSCTDEQMAALANARDYGVSILCGSAGTGKSAATKSLIAMLEDNGMSYCLLAPTGIAAKRLSDATERKAQTIHRWLLKKTDEQYDYIIVDEFSMVGVELLSYVLKDIRCGKNTRLIFVCDNAQLASISPGNVIQDIMDSGIVPTAELTKVFRYGKGGIATLATDIRCGDSEKVNIDMEYAAWNDLKIWNVANDPIEQVRSIYADYKCNPADILVLSAMKIGKYGSWQLNNAIQEILDRKTETGFGYTLGTGQNAVKIQFYIGDKVINVKNNYHALCRNEDGELRESGVVVNGDIGYIQEVIEDEEFGKLLVVQFDNAVICYSKKTIKQIQLGYALTCHKTQGQQSTFVIFLSIDESHKLLTRNLLYVAATRAQKHLTLIGDNDSIELALNRVENKQRNTNLKEMLENEN